MKRPRLFGPGIALLILGVLSVNFVHGNIRLSGLDFRIYTVAYIARNKGRTSRVIDNQAELTEYWTQLRLRQGPASESGESRPGDPAAGLPTEYLHTGPPALSFAKEFLIIFNKKVRVRSIIFNGNEVFVRYSPQGEIGRPADTVTNRTAYFTAVAVIRPENWPVPVIYHEIE